MYPIFNTVTGNNDGLRNYQLGYEAFRGLPSIINDNFEEGLSSEEIESVALFNSIANDEFIVADELGGGKQSLLELGLDQDFLGNTLLRKQLGYLSNDEVMDIEDFTTGATGSTKNNFLKIMSGRTSEILANLKDKESDDADFKVYSYFTPAIDPETGEYTLKQVVGTKESLAKVELAGSSVINSYGPKKFSSNIFEGFAKGFAQGVHNLYPTLIGFGAAVEDIGETAVNGLTTGNWDSDYDEWNALNDYREMELEMDTMHGNTTMQQDAGAFNSLEGLGSAVGNGLASLVGFGVYGRSIAAVASRLGAAAETVDIASRVGAGMILNGGEAYQAAKEAGLSGPAAAGVMLLTGALNTLIENKFGSNVLTSWLASGKSGQAVARTVVNEAGGDITKLANRGIQNKILNSLMNTVDKFTANAGLIGTAFEEGAEEFMQSYIKSSVETLYDEFIAPDAEVGQGKFGTEVWSKEQFTQALEEAAVGAIVGGLGGLVHSKSKENTSIVPYIASGEYESLLAGMNLALKKGAITQEQYNGIKARADKLNQLYKDNKSLFAQVASRDKAQQAALSEVLLKQLRDQDEYIESTTSGLEDGYTKFGNLLAESLGGVNTLGIATTERFENALRQAGRTEEADIIKTSRNDTKRQIQKVLPKPKKFNNSAEESAWRMARYEIEQQIYSHNISRQLNQHQMRKVNAELNSLKGRNAELVAISDSLFTQESQYQKGLATRMEAIENAKNLEELETARKNATDYVSTYIGRFADAHPEIPGISEWAELQASAINLGIDDSVDKKALQMLSTNSDYVKQRKEAITKQIELFDKLAQEQRKLDEIAAKRKKIRDYFDSSEYKAKLDETITNPDSTPETVELYKKAKNGDTASQIAIASREMNSLIAQKKAAPADQQKAFNEQIDNKQAEIDYLKEKKVAEDKENALRTPHAVKAEFAKTPSDDEKGNPTVIDKNTGKKYKLLKDRTMRSEEAKFIYTITDETGEEYDVAQDELVPLEIEGLDKTLAELAAEHEEAYQKALKGIKTTPGQDDPVEITDRKKEVVKETSDHKYQGVVKLTAKGKFADILNDPKTDVSKLEADVEVSDNIEELSGYEKEKKAYQQFKALTESTDPVAALEAMSESERDFMVEYLPIKATIVNRGYSNILYGFSVNSKSKQILVRELLKNKKVHLPAGSMIRYPGYVNYLPNTNNSLVKALNLRKNKDGEYAFPDGTPVRIGVAGANGEIYYPDPEGKDEYVKTANVSSPAASGNVFLIIPGNYQFTGNEGYTAKLNPTKVPADVAQVIAEIFAAATRISKDTGKKEIRLKDVIKADNPFGIKSDSFDRIKYVDFLNSLIYFDESTEGTDKAVFFGKDGFIRYSASNKILDPTSQASINEFAAWLSQNKNLAISRALLQNKMPVTFGFTVGNITFKAGESYLNTIIENGFVHTDLDIRRGLIRSTKSASTDPTAYLAVTVTASAAPAKTTTNTPVTKGSSNPATESRPTEIDFRKGKSPESVLQLVKDAPDGTAFIVGGRTDDKDSNNAKVYPLYKKGEELVDSTGNVVINLGEQTNEKEFRKLLRKTLIDNYNRAIKEAIDAHEKDSSNNQSERDHIPNKISTTKDIGKKVPKFVTDPDYYQNLKVIKIIYPKETKSVVKKGKKAAEKPATPISPANPFTALEQTPEVKALSNVYEKLLSILKTDDVNMYESAVNVINADRTALVDQGISEAELNAVLDYILPDGTQVVAVLKNLGKTVQKPQIAPEPINKSSEKKSKKKADKKKQENEPITADSVTEKTSPFHLGPISSNPEAYQALIAEWNKMEDNMSDEISNEQVDAIISRLNDLISGVLPEYEIIFWMRSTGHLKLKKRPNSEPKTPNDIAEVPVNSTPTANELAAAAGVNPVGNVAPKKNFGFGKPSTKGAPMEVSKSSRTTRDIRKEMLMYRAMLGNLVGGEIKFVDELIKVLGESGNPTLAWAVMTELGVTLYEKPAEGALYHEGFHRVSLLVLTPEQRKQLYKLARKEYSLFTQTDREVEEFLAERFREQVLETGKPKGAIRQFFSDMINFIKSFLGLNKVKIDNIQGFFNAIQNGKYKYAKINEAALNNFKMEYVKGNPPLTVNGVTLKQVRNSAMLSNVVNSLTAMVLRSNGIHNINDLANGLSFKETKDQIREFKDKYEAAANNASFPLANRLVYGSWARIYGEVLDNFGTVFRPLIDVKLQGHNIRRVENQLEDKDSLNDLVNDEIRSAYEFSAKENAAADVRVMFLTLRKSDELDYDTGLPQYHNSEEAWNAVFDVVRKANNVEEMVAMLRKEADATNTINQANGLSSQINMFTELLDVLTESDEEGNQDEMLKTRFWNTFKKHRNAFVNANFSREVDAEGRETNSYSCRFGDADLNKRSRQIERNWSSMFGLNHTFEDTEKLEKAIEDYDALVRKTKTADFEATSYKENVNELVRILNSVGISIDYNTIGVLLNKHYYNANLNTALKHLINSTPKLGGKDSVGLLQLFGERGVFQKLIDGKIEDVNSKALDLLSDEKAVKELSRAYVAAHKNIEDDSVLGPGGNLVYSYSEHNTITALFEDWLKDDEFFSQLNGVTYNKSSYWLSLMADPKVRAKMSVETMLSVINTDEFDTGRGYLEIAPNEDLLLKFNATYLGRMLLPTLANKRTYYFINGIKPIDVSLQDGKLDEKTVDIFVNYAIGEYKTIQEAIKAKNKFLERVGVTEEKWNEMSKSEQDVLMKDKNTNYKDLVENYHYVIKGGAMRFTGNGYNFRYFSSFQNKLNDASFFTLENKTLRNAVNKILVQQVNNTIKQFINQKLISGAEKYSDAENIKEQDNSKVNLGVITGNRLLPQSIFKTANKKEDIAEAIAKYAINSAISVYEFEKLVSGDVAYYKGGRTYQAMLDDRVKRYSALTSTKSVLREEWPEGFLDFDTHKYRTAIFSTNIVKSQEMYDEMYAKYVGTDENHGLLWKQYEMFRDQKLGKFANMSDEEIKQEAAKEADRRLNGYLETDQTDAQVLISPQMFRKLSIMNGEWDGAKEEAYNLLESDEELSIEEELQAYSVVMQPLKYIHFGYDFFNGLQVPIYDKMSLATVFKRVAKGRDLQKVYDFMRDNNVDMVKFDTAVKSGLRQKGTFYVDGKPNESLNDTPVYEQQFKYLGKQLVTDPHHVSRIALGTQMVKIGVAGVEDNAQYDLAGKKVTGQQMISDYVQAISRLSAIGKNHIVEDYGITEVVENGKTYLTVDREKFMQMLRDDAINSNSPSNLIDALKVKDNENGGQDYYVELSGLPALAWIQSRIISAIKKEAVDVNTPGGAMIQMSNFAYKDSFTEVSTKGYNYETNKELRFKNNDNRLECIVSINLFKDVLPEAYLAEEAKKNKTTYFEEARKFILANKDLAVLSYRIPTQGMNSTLPVEIVDVLPSSVGDTIVLPAELTKLTGADFDVDKMYLARYNYDVVGGKLYKHEFIDDLNGIDEDGNQLFLSEDEFLKKVYNNKMRWYNHPMYREFQDAITKLIHYTQVNINRTGEITEEDAELLKAFKKKYAVFIDSRHWDNILRSEKIPVQNKMKALSNAVILKGDRQSLEEFIEQNRGKDKWQLNDSRAVENKLLEIFQSILTSENHYMDATVPLDFATDALKEVVKVVDKYSNLNKDYADTEPLFPLYQEGIKTQNVGADAGIGPMALINTFRVMMQISKLRLYKGKRIEFKRGDSVVKRNLFALIPEIGNLYDKFDANGVSIMDWTSALINAHVDAAKDSYITRLNVNSYTYDMVALLISAGVGSNTFYFLPQPILKEIADESIRRSQAKIGVDKREKRDRTWRDGIVNKYAKKAQIGNKFYEALDDGTLKVKWNGKEYLAQDIVMNKAWLEEQMRLHSEKKMDAEWYKNQVIIFEYFRDIQDYSKSLSNLVLASQIDTGKLGKNEAELILSLHNLEKARNDQHFFNASEVFTKTFLGDKLKNSTMLLFDLLQNEMLDFSKGYLALVNSFGRLSDTYYDRKTNNIIKYMSELKFVMQAEFFNEYLKQNNIVFKDLFYGDNTIVDRVNKLRNEVMSGAKYPELANNMLLQIMLPGITQEGKPKRFETILKMRDADSKNSYTYAWRDLLEHRDPEVRQIAKDLILYSFYTSGGRGTGLYATLDLVPFEVLGNMSIIKDGVDYTYNQHLKDKLRNSNEGTLDYHKYLDYAFRAMQSSEDVVQQVKRRYNSPVKAKQLDENGNPIYIAMDSKYYKTTDGYPLPYVQHGTTLMRLIGTAAGDTSDIAIYAAVKSINYREKGFTINEGTSNSSINEGLDATDRSIPFNKEMEDLGDILKIDDPFSWWDNTMAAKPETEPDSENEQIDDSVNNPVNSIETVLEKHPFIRELIKLGRQPVPDVSDLSVIREIDKTRSDNNKITKKSPSYIAFSNLIDISKFGYYPGIDENLNKLDVTDALKEKARNLSKVIYNSITFNSINTSGNMMLSHGLTPEEAAVEFYNNTKAHYELMNELSMAIWGVPVPTTEFKFHANDPGGAIENLFNNTTTADVNNTINSNQDRLSAINSTEMSTEESAILNSPEERVARANLWNKESILDAVVSVDGGFTVAFKPTVDSKMLTGVITWNENRNRFEIGRQLNEGYTWDDVHNDAKEDELMSLMLSPAWWQLQVGKYIPTELQEYFISGQYAKDQQATLDYSNSLDPNLTTTEKARLINKSNVGELAYLRDNWGIYFINEYTDETNYVPVENTTADFLNEANKYGYTDINWNDPTQFPDDAMKTCKG